MKLMIVYPEYQNEKSLPWTFLDAYYLNRWALRKNIETCLVTNAPNESKRDILEYIMSKKVDLDAISWIADHPNKYPIENLIEAINQEKPKIIYYTGHAENTGWDTSKQIISYEDIYSSIKNNGSLVIHDACNFNFKELPFVWSDSMNKFCLNTQYKIKGVSRGHVIFLSVQTDAGKAILTKSGSVLLRSILQLDTLNFNSDNLIDLQRTIEKSFLGERLNLVVYSNRPSFIEINQNR